jgi:hypothetical protein
MLAALIAPKPENDVGMDRARPRCEGGKDVSEAPGGQTRETPADRNRLFKKLANRTRDEKEGPAISRPKIV